MIGLLKTFLKIIEKIVSVVYAVLKSFRLQFLALTIIFSVILYIVKVIPENQTMMIIVYVAFGISCVYSIFSNYNRIKKIFNSDKNKESNIENKGTTLTNENQQVNQSLQNANTINNNEIYPKYFIVRQNRNFIMAEYKDRYELLLKKDGNLIKMRTDYKRDIR